MRAEKWHVIGGQVYRLADVFVTSREALTRVHRQTDLRFAKNLEATDWPFSGLKKEATSLKSH